MSANLDATALRSALEVAESWLAANRDAINAINVYPVPDGDTGTNMLLTWRAALRAADEVDGHVGAILSAAQRGALLGARGNSGVILSQMLRGFAEAVDSSEAITPAQLASALERAASAAYEAVSNPVEGTMLTVMRDGAAAAVASDGEAHDAVLVTFVEEAFASVDRTPDLLPRLKDAGVVDAGGMGIAVLFQGLLHGLTGEPLPEATVLGDSATVELAGVEHEGHGYCTEFVILGRDIDRPSIEAALQAAGGDSILVVGDATAVHVHVHMEDPGPAISVGSASGALDSVKVENMQAQHEDWTAGHAETDPADLPSIGLVAVAHGPGLAAAYRDLGATQILDGGPTGKASAGELLEAARRAGRDRVFILPNDKDVLMAAGQAAAEAPELIIVIPTRSAAAGLSAAVPYLPEGDADALAEQMTEAVEGIRSVEVSVSVRDATVDGVEVAAGDAIALLDGVLTARAASVDEALMAGLAEAVSDESELVTLYLGEEASDEDGERVTVLIETAHPQLEVEIVSGGQPHYPYIAGVE
jgi:DAK2 domain fusion protein YloV